MTTPPAPARSRAEIEARLRAARPRTEALEVRSLRLFGSAARDALMPGSDIDILVEFHAAPSLRGFMALEELLGRRIDLVTAAALPSRLRERIARDLRDVA